MKPGETTLTPALASDVWNRNAFRPMAQFFARANNLDAYQYLKCLLTEIPNSQYLEHPEILDQYLLRQTVTGKSYAVESWKIEIMRDFQKGLRVNKIDIQELWKLRWIDKIRNKEWKAYIQRIYPQTFLQQGEFYGMVSTIG